MNKMKKLLLFILHRTVGCDEDNGDIEINKEYQCLLPIL